MSKFTIQIEDDDFVLTLIACEIHSLASDQIHRSDVFHEQYLYTVHEGSSYQRQIKHLKRQQRLELLRKREQNLQAVNASTSAANSNQ